MCTCRLLPLHASHLPQQLTHILPIPYLDDLHRIVHTIKLIPYTPYPAIAALTKRIQTHKIRREATLRSSATSSSTVPVTAIAITIPTATLALVRQYSKPVECA